MRIAIILALVLVLAFSAQATTVSLYPDQVLSGTNKEYNLTLNNHNYKDILLNITLESPSFTFTQGFGGQDWSVTQTATKVVWNNNTLGKDVVYALFPFRATSPIVNETGSHNITITLIGNDTIQRLHREIKVVAPAQKKEALSLTTKIVKPGSNVINYTGNGTDLSAKFLDQDVTFSKNQITLNVPAGTVPADHPLLVKGNLNGTEFEQTIIMSVIDDVSISLVGPSVVNTSAGFLISGTVTAAGKSLNGSKVTVYWQDGTNQKALDSENQFVIGLVAPSEVSELTVLVQFDYEGYVYSQKLPIKVVNLLITTNSAVNTTVNVSNETNTSTNETKAVIEDKTKIRDSSSRSSVLALDPIKPSRKIPVRPVVITILVIVCLLLIYLAFSNMNFKLFSRQKEKELENEEESGGIDWDDYFDKRRKDDD